MPNHTITKEEIKKYYRISTNPNQKELWKCVLCAETKNPIRQKKGSGYTNLRNHLFSAHPNWNTQYIGKDMFEKYIRPKASNTYGWMKKVIFNCQPLSIVENPIELEYTKLKAICRKTLKVAINKTFKEVFEKVVKLLPSKFCLCFDAWTDNKTHFVATYAVFSDSQNIVHNILLSFGTLIDESNWSAHNYADTITTLLESVNKTVDNIVCLVGDNCATNKALANILGLPLVGCASHKLNLAIEKLIDEFSEINLLNQLMIKLSTPLKIAKLRLQTEFKPITRNVTRWSSCFHMIRRFFELKEYIDTSDPILAELMPNHVQILQLTYLLNEFTLLDELTIYLQKSSLNLLDTRNCFDKVIIRHHKMAKYLDVNAKIVHCPKFDSGVIKVLKGKENELDTEETNYLIKLESDCSVLNDLKSFEENPFICQSTMHSSRFSRYMDLSFIPPTSNMVERLFSLAGRIYSENRKNFKNSTLEQIMFLNQNKDLWNEDVVDKILE